MSKSPERRPLLKQEPLIWNAVYDRLATDIEGDEPSARALADEVSTALRVYEKYRTQERRLRLLKWAVPQLRRFGSWFGETVIDLGPIAAFVIATLAVIALVCWGTVVGCSSFVAYNHRIHADDYAGVDPGSVVGGAIYGLEQWYGENEPLPAHMRLASKAHAVRAFGEKAWLVRFNAPENKSYCVYVWDDSSGTPYTKIVSCQSTR